MDALDKIDEPGKLFKTFYRFLLYCQCWISLPEAKVNFPELFIPSGGKKKQKQKSTKGAFQPLKNPCLALNELRPGLEYKVADQIGPVHMPTFKISIELDGKTFVGEGRYIITLVISSIFP